MPYTDQAAFSSALPVASTIANFDGTTADTLVPSGTAIDGITFAYDFGGISLKVATTATAGYSTTSGAHFLGTDDADILQDGDDILLSFPSSSAIGLYIISNDELLENDVTLAAGGASASIVAADVQATLADGSNVYFLGIVDAAAAFTSASLTTPGNGEFLFNIDDVVIAYVTDTDGDSIPDVYDDDDDNDFLTDLEEAALGTNPLLADTDGDGVIDGEDQYPLDNTQAGIAGDVDGNTLIDVSDLLLLQRYLIAETGLSSQQLYRADIHPAGGNDAVNIADLLRLEQLVTE